MPSGAVSTGDTFTNFGGTLRDFLNAVLAFIGASSLTDGEYSAINQTGLVVSTYDLTLYTALSAVLVSREAVSTTTDRLYYFFLSKGVAVVPITKGKSNIYIGDVLE